LVQRLEAQLMGQEFIGITTCQQHLENFFTNYLEFQVRIVGCCNPTNKHVTSHFANLRLVEKSLPEKIHNEHPYVLEGRVICIECLNEVFNKNAQYLRNAEDDYKQYVTTKYPKMESSLRPHQISAISVILRGKDLLCCTPTGSGKTLSIIAPSIISSAKVIFKSFPLLY
jgi:hypothetical protein